MKQQPDGTKDIITQVKNPELVERRRQQILDAAVSLFIEKGFHKTTTRQIAKAAGLSIGSLYEYIASKEDILYIVCNAIHADVVKGVEEALARTDTGLDALAEIIREFFLICNRMCDLILLIYKETRSLPSKWQQKLLENELNITNIFEEAIADLVESGNLPEMDKDAVELIAHNISVLGHMWTFRRWFLARHYNIEDYIKFQTEYILGIFNLKNEEQ